MYINMTHLVLKKIIPIRKIFCSWALLGAFVASSVSAYGENSVVYTVGIGRSCVDASCSAIFVMESEIPGENQYQAVCLDLWQHAAYIFPGDAYSHGAADGNCYYHHISSPNYHIVFGSWNNIWR